VLEPDRRQRRHSRRQHVCGVQAPTKSCLDHSHLDPSCGQGDEGGGSGRLELRHGLALLETAVDDVCGVGDALDRGREVGCTDLLSTDQHALRPALVVGRKVGARADAVGLQEGRGNRRDRRLAVRADHVDRGEAVLRHPERGDQALNPIQAEAPAERLE
jgi:hypothetical protein